MVFAEFRDTIYPGLVSSGKVERSGDRPFHIVVNGENYRVLKALTYTHRGEVWVNGNRQTGSKFSVGTNKPDRILLEFERVTRS